MTWALEGIGKGYSTAVGDGTTIYITGKKGNNDYLSAISKKEEILWQVPFGPVWAHLSIYDGLLFIRRGDALMAFDISKKRY